MREQQEPDIGKIQRALNALADGSAARSDAVATGDPNPAGASIEGAQSSLRDRDASDVHLLDYFRILHKRRWTAGSVVIAALLGVAIYLITATPIYEASTRLLIEAEKQNVVTFKEVVEDESQPTDAYYQTLYKLLESRALAAETIAALDLWKDPQLCASCPAATGHFPLFNGTFAAVRRLSARAPASGVVAMPDGERPDQSQVIDAFLKRLSIAPVRNSRLVDVRFRSTDPALAARVANTHVRGYIAKNLEFKFLASKEATDWLAERLAEQRQKLEESESAVQQYREHNGAVSLQERQNIVVQKLGDLNTAVTKAKTERIEKEALYRQLESISRDPSSLDTLPAVLTNAFIQQLKAQLADLQRHRAQLSETLGERHPEMVKTTTAIQDAERKLRTEIEKVAESVRNAYQAAVAQETSLVAALDEQKREALAMNRRDIKGSVLQRDADSNRQLYETLLQRTKETRVSGELKTSNIRLVDLAEAPRAPVTPDKAEALLIGLLCGTLLGITLVFFVEYLDDRIKTPDDIKTHLGLTTLGLVPRVAPKVLGPHPLISNGVPAGFAEAFRMVRTSILFAFPDTADVRSRTLVVTSTAPREGKTLSACNLAVGIAQASERVLLLDADLRLPRVHTLFDIEREPGLSDLLVGAARANDAIRPSTIPGLSLLPGGRTPPNPSELLGSPRFKSLLTILGAHFRWIIIDAPPVLAVSDSSILAHLADGTLFVVGAEMTSRRTARTATDCLVRAHGRFVGAVLNRVSLERNRYYYAPYQRAEYGEYYVGATPSSTA
jgi:capsular exopolysaccharide synthesis family protein